MIPYVKEPRGRLQKRGRTQHTNDAICAEDVLMEEHEDLEATGRGAAGKLTGPHVAPRQQQ